MTKQDFVDWKRHPVTQQVFSQLEERMNYYTACLIEQGGNDSLVDKEHSTYIKALRDLLSIEFEEESYGD